MSHSATPPAEIESLARLGTWEFTAGAERGTVSPGVLTLLGLPPGPAPSVAEMLGWIEPDDRQRTTEELTRAFTEGGTYRTVFKLRRPGDGMVIHIEAGGLVEPGATGVPHMRGYLQDVSQRERQIADRVRQHEAAVRELDSLTYGISHDLRAPLRAIDGFSQAAIEDAGVALDPTVLRHLQRVRAGAGRLGTLIEGLLHLSRLVRGEVRRTRCDVSALARRILGGLAASRPERDVRWSVADGIAVEADQALLETLLRNLLDNAWKFTSTTPGAVIAVEAHAEDGLTGFLVRDNGVGFDMAYAARLFGAFQRLHAEHEFPGEGIGLAAVRRIVNRHGGLLRAEASPGQGATFLVAF